MLRLNGPELLKEITGIDAPEEVELQRFVSYCKIGLLMSQMGQLKKSLSIFTGLRAQIANFRKSCLHYIYQWKSKIVYVQICDLKLLADCKVLETHAQLGNLKEVQEEAVQMAQLLEDVSTKQADSYEEVRRKLYDLALIQMSFGRYLLISQNLEDAQTMFSKAFQNVTSIIELENIEQQKTLFASSETKRKRLKEQRKLRKKFEQQQLKE